MSVILEYHEQLPAADSRKDRLQPRLKATLLTVAHDVYAVYHVFVMFLYLVITASTELITSQKPAPQNRAVRIG